MRQSDRLTQSPTRARHIRILGSVCTLVTVLDLIGAGRALGAETGHRPATGTAAGHRRAPGSVSSAPDSASSARTPAASLMTTDGVPRQASTPQVTAPSRPSTTPPTTSRPASNRPSEAHGPASSRPVPPTTPVPAPSPTTRPPTTQPAPKSASPAPTSPPPAPPPPPTQPAPPAETNPPQSIPPDAAFQQACWGSSPDLAKCNQAALTDIDKARSSEGLGSLQLPADFYNLSVPAQLIAVANAERTSRGLPAMGESASLDRSAQQGAQSGQDPTGPSGYAWASNYAVGDPTALAADYSWMYDDGPGSNNVDCTPSNQSGCWGHREDILSPWAGSAGAGTAETSNGVAMTQLFVENWQGS